MKNTLDKLFTPKSVALIGASHKSHSVGKKVLTNLIYGNFSGKIFPVNPKYATLQGLTCFSSISNIKSSIDLAVIVTPARIVPTVLTECGEKGVKTVIIISAGFSETGFEGKILEKAIWDIAKKFKIRMIGPNCLGVMLPLINFNATFDNNFALPGNLALLSQSGALCSAIVDWTLGKKIGFSAVISLGNSVDIGFGELLSYLAHDKKTHAILLYIEGIHDSTQFISGLRKAARKKPVIVIKSGRFAQGTRAALAHTGALIGDDDVFDSALQQSGAIRVKDIESLFSAAEILSSSYHLSGNGLTIITNGGGAGVMAADRAAELNISLPSLDEKTISQLNKILPSHWSHQNPIDLIGDATPTRYHAAIDICLKDKNTHGLLIILVPVALAKPKEVAKQIIADAKKSHKPILVCWMGYKQVKSSYQLFYDHKIPCFDTPEKAVEAFSYLVAHHHRKYYLSQRNHISGVTPSPTIIKEVRDIIKNKKILTAKDSKHILSLFSITTIPSIEVNTVEEAVVTAQKIGFPVALKINSADITHKQDVGGVKLNITNAEAVRQAFRVIKENTQKIAPMGNITIEKMYKTDNDRELMIGMKYDKVFGPVISFGAGGTLVEIMKDRALALPPLNNFLARELISHTRIAKLLEDFRGMPAANIRAIEEVLLKVSHLVCALPEINALDINPLIANEKDVIALDARIIIN